MVRQTVEQRFFSKVRKSEGCWEWTGAKLPHNYGNFWYEGRTARAHRVAWILKHGPIPAGKQVLHSCDNPPCVRDEHLFLGTSLDNMLDKVAKNRAHGAHAGESHHKAKMTVEKVRELRRLYGTGLSTGKLGKLFGISHPQASKIARGIHWKDP